MRIKPFQAVYPNFDYITSADSFFGTVKYEYPEYVESGFFQKTSQEAIYIYQIKAIGRVYTGIIACADIRDYKEGKIKKHENTLAEKEQQQMHLMLKRNAMVKPVLLTYPNVPELDSFIANYIKNNKAFFSTEFIEDAQVHTLWEVSDGEQIQKLRNLFKKKVPHTYIADGHHRVSTSALMYDRLQSKNEGDYKLLLSAFFPSQELDIHDYNRIVIGFNEQSLSSLVVKLSQVFDIDILAEPRKPKEKHELVMILNKEWFSLKWKPSILKKYEKEKVLLDANLLDLEVMQSILGIEDVRTDSRLKYVEGTKGIEELRIRANKGEQRIAFCLFKVELSDLMQIADANKIMPPKSTWFEPRMKNGLIAKEF